MSSSHIFVLSIIVLGLGFSLIKTWLGDRDKKTASAPDGEVDDMLEKIEVLEERIRVLERIVTERDVDLKQQIDNL